MSSAFGSPLFISLATQNSPYLLSPSLITGQHYAQEITDSFIHLSLSFPSLSPSLFFSPSLSPFLPPLAVFGLTSLYPFPSSMPFQFLQGPMVQVRFIHLSCNQEGSLNSEPFLGSCEVGRLFQAGYLRTLSASVPPLCFLLINRTAIPKGMHPLPFSRAEFIFHCMFLFKQKAF